jgi:16S rRNA (cytosine967-C5)-methyltransferase
LTKPHRPLFQAVTESLKQIFGDGFYADKVIERQFKANKQWGSRDRKFIAETIYESVRWWRKIWFCLDEEPSLQTDALWKFVGTWLVISQHEWATSVLESWGELKDLNPARIQERLKQAQKIPVIRESLPDWLFERGEAELGTQWEKILVHLNQQAPAFLRTNTLLIQPKELQATLAQEKIETDRVEELPQALRLKERKNLFALKSFHSGFFEMQDGASQQIAPFLNPEPGLRVIDACAGAGGKTLHLAALMKNKGKIIAMDVEEKKLTELKRRAARAKVDIVETKWTHSNKVIKRLEASADRVLLDVPCSGLGVVRRNPDTKWKLNPEKLAALLQIQAEILENYSRLLKPGGELVYATCSILPSENEKQVESFLSRHDSQWSLLEEKKFSPGHHGFDGFYAARLTLKKN